MTQTSEDRIEKEIRLKAPRARVWRALTDAAEFGEWFGVELQGPFVPGEKVSGTIRFEKREFTFEAWVERMEPETSFSFRWHPYAVDPDTDYSDEPTTLVEFTLADSGEGTTLTVVESGFEHIPKERRAEAFRMNTGGWEHQVKNIQRHVEG